MSIHVILGKPGAGKSLFATSRLIRDLVESEKNIVTNLPLNLGRLNEYLQEQHSDRDCRLVQRLRLLEESELQEFWKFRGPKGSERNYPADLPSYDSWRSPFRFELGQVVTEEVLNAMSAHEADQRREYDALQQRRTAEQREWLRVYGEEEGRGGVVYYLDEAHIAFNARDWASIGRGALHYLSQHRKLGDTVFVITQSASNLDKQFRSVAEDFTVLENQYTKQYSIFRAPGRFVRKHYYKEPSGSVEAYDKGAFTLDEKGIASCYDTAKGIGVHGSKADIGRRAKGIPIYWLLPAGVVLCLGCIIVPWVLAKGVSGVIMKQAKPAAQKVAAGAIGKESILPDMRNPETKTTPLEKTEKQQEVYVTSLVNDMAGLELRTTDGRVRRGAELNGIRYTPEGVTLPDGTWIPFKPVTFAAIEKGSQ